MAGRLGASHRVVSGEDNTGGKSKGVQAINKPYEISLFYKAAPVFLSSEVVVEPPRVSEASFGINLMGKERGSER